MIVDKRLERILPRVQKPARYVGGEYNAVVKDKAEVDTRIAFCFPDTYARLFCLAIITPTKKRR